MTKFEHKDGSTVKLGFTYALSAGKSERINAPDVIPTKVGIQYMETGLASDWIPSSEGMTGGAVTGGTDMNMTHNAQGVIPTKVGIQYEESSGHASDWIPFFEGMTDEMTVADVDTNMTYDDWGQLSGKSQGRYSADYEWRYGHKLSKVTSNFPGEGTVRYAYRGDGRRLFRVESPSGAYTRYNYDLGWNVQSEDDTGNNLQTTFTYDNPAAQVAGALAEISGSNPSNGTAKYYFRDHLGSTRRVHAADKSTLATTEYQPYGDTYSTSGTQPRFTFTGKPWDATAAMYYFPYRHYSPSMAIWINRDPAGHVDGPNVYAYTKGFPVCATDRKGLEVSWRCPLGERVTQVLQVGAIAASWANTLKRQAQRVSHKELSLPGKTNGPEDAFRHCYWSCKMAQSWFIGPVKAMMITVIHELCNWGPLNERSMDLHNNRVGITLGTWPLADCWMFCLSSDQLQVLDVSLWRE